MEFFDPEQNDQRFVSEGDEYKFSYNGQTENVAKALQEKQAEEQIKAYEKYMPLGSIVSIDNNSKKLMIIGYNYSQGDIVSDYLSCEFPFGIDKQHAFSCFNHNQITQVYNIGYINAFGNSYRDSLLDQQQPKSDGPKL